MQYPWRVIWRVKDTEETPEVKKKSSTNGFVKFSKMSHKWEKKSDPTVACIMFHKVANMCRGVKL